MKSFTTISIGFAALMLTGCSVIGDVPAGKVDLGGEHSLVLDREWSDVSALFPSRNSKVRVLSIDGPLLNRLYLVSGLSAGEGLTTARDKDHPAPTFAADMAPSDLVGFMSDSVAALGYQRVSTGGLRPAAFGDQQALRVDVDAQTEDGLAIKGTAEMVVVSGKFYAVIYLAPREHFYPTTLPNVEAAMASAR